MAILYDARGNEIKGHFPDAVTNETVTDARTVSAVLGSLNAEAVIDLNGAQTLGLDLRTGAGVLTCNIEGSFDGANYTVTMPIFMLSHATAALVNTFGRDIAISASTVAGITSVAGFRRVRVRVSAYTSGNVTATMRASAALNPLLIPPFPSILHQTGTAAANTLAVATLPAAGPGLFHFVTRISMVRNATAVLLGSATLIHTSTNMPGSPAWSVGNVMAAGGTEFDVDYTPGIGLRSLVANTATTFTMQAAGAAVLNRVNVSYYVGM